MPEITDIVNQTLSDELFLEKMTRRHEARLLSSIKKLRDNITNMLTELETTPAGRLMGVKTNLKQAQRIHKKVVIEFEKEYGKTVDSILGDFSEISSRVSNSYRHLGEAANFTSIDKQMMDILKSQTYSRYIEFGDNARDRIARMMYDSVVSGEKFSTLVNSIAGALTGHKDSRGRSMTLYAQGFAQDSVMNFHNHVNVKKGEDAGMTHFLYFGDLILTSRPFCISRAGKVYSKAQILAWNSLQWQGKSGPALSDRGGYNCRHHWRPVRPTWLKDSLGEDISREELVAYMNPAVPGVNKTIKKIEKQNKKIESAVARMGVLRDKQKVFKANKASGNWTKKMANDYAKLRIEINDKQKGIIRELKAELRELKAEMKAHGKSIVKKAKKKTVVKKGVKKVVKTPVVKKDVAVKKKALGKIRKKEVVDLMGQPDPTGGHIYSTVKMVGEEVFEFEDDLGVAYGRVRKMKGAKTRSTFRLSSLQGFQEVVDKEKLMGMIDDFDLVMKNKGPLVLRFRNKNVLYDGYHRVNAAKYMGMKELEFDFIDVDSLLKKPKPVKKVKIPKVKKNTTVIVETPGPQRVIRYWDTSDSFVEEAVKNLSEIPLELQERVRLGGFDISLGNHISQVKPMLANKSPAGWGSRTWDYAEGLVDPIRMQMIVTERKLDWAGDWVKVEKSRQRKVFFHEYGHTVDHAFENMSSSKKFIEAYEKDVIKLKKEYPEMFLQNYEYFLQEGRRGRSETFAELFGDLMGDVETEGIARAFSNTRALMEKELGFVKAAKPKAVKKAKVVKKATIKKPGVYWKNKRIGDTDLIRADRNDVTLPWEREAYLTGDYLSNEIRGIKNEEKYFPKNKLAPLHDTQSYHQIIFEKGTRGVDRERIEEFTEKSADRLFGDDSPKIIIRSGGYDRVAIAEQSYNEATNTAVVTLYTGGPGYKDLVTGKKLSKSKIVEIHEQAIAHELVHVQQKRRGAYEVIYAKRAEEVVDDVLKPAPPMTKLVAQGEAYERVDGVWYLRKKKVTIKKEIDRLNKLGAPPGWKNVVASVDPKSKVQVIGQDAAGRWQYRYNAEFRQNSAMKKFRRQKQFSKSMPKIKKQITAGIKAGDDRAFLLDLENKTAIRVGTDTDFKAKKKAYGLTTLQNEHVVIKGNKIILDFVAKEGIPAHYEIQDSKLAKWLKSKKQVTKKGEQLFPNINGKKLNNYLKEIAKEKYTIKDFRTYHGTRIAFEELKKYSGKVLTTKEKKAIVKKVSTTVSKFLKNTPSMAIKSYIDPMVWEFIGGL